MNAHRLAVAALASHIVPALAAATKELDWIPGAAGRHARRNTKGEAVILDLDMSPTRDGSSRPLVEVL